MSPTIGAVPSDPTQPRRTARDSAVPWRARLAAAGAAVVLGIAGPIGFAAHAPAGTADASGVSGWDSVCQGTVTPLPDGVSGWDAVCGPDAVDDGVSGWD